MSYKLPFFLLVTGMIVASVIPFGMSQQPEDAFMEIDMLQGQTQNPFRIQDTQDVDVFSVDTNGVITPDQDGWYNFNYNKDFISYTNVDEANAIVVSEWNLNVVGNHTDLWMFYHSDIVGSSEVRESSAGANQCVFDVRGHRHWEPSDEYQIQEQMSNGSTDWTVDLLENQSDPFVDLDNIKMVFYISGDGVGVCEWANMTFIMELQKLEHMTIERIL